MKKINPQFAIALILIIISSCRTNNTKQDTLLTAKPHIEDSIIYNVPTTPRLCDAIKGEKKFIEIGDCKLYCEIEGEGIPMVLIHGGPGGTHHCFHPWLTDASKQFKVIYYDQRGCGLSDFMAGEGYSFEQTVNDLENLRKALKIDKWIVMGHSFGGAVAQYYTIKYPQNVIGQILVGAVPMMNNPEINAIRENHFLNKQEIQKLDEITKLIIAGKLTYEQYFYNNSINGGWKRQNFIKPTNERQAQMATYDIVFDKTFNSDFDAYNLEHAFDHCPVPTLICEGKYDSLWSAKKILLFRNNHPNSTFVHFEQSSHNIYSDEPELFINSITEWADTIKPATVEDITEWISYTNELLSDQLNLINSQKLFIKTIKAEDIKATRKYYNDFKKSNPNKALFSERALNTLAYKYLNENKVDLAIALFTLITKEYPQSWNAFDSLAEAYMKAENLEEAINYYKKSLAMNPANANAEKTLKTLIQ